MPTSQRNKITPDRGHVAIGEEKAVKYLFRHLGVAERSCGRAVKKVIIRLRASAKNSEPWNTRQPCPSFDTRAFEIHGCKACRVCKPVRPKGRRTPPSWRSHLCVPELTSRFANVACAKRDHRPALGDGLARASA